MGKKVALFIDGGCLMDAVRSIRIKHSPYTPELIERIAHSCIAEDEDLLRILYYDCPLDTQEQHIQKPISGNKTKLKRKPSENQWLIDLARRDLFGVVKGRLVFKGWKLKNSALRNRQSNAPLTDDDFRPNFQQKGVDMRLGIDIAVNAIKKTFDVMIIITRDTDFIPVLKLARKEGIQIVLIKLPNRSLPPLLIEHTDYVRAIEWPEQDIDGQETSSSPQEDTQE